MVFQDTYRSRLLAHLYCVYVTKPALVASNGVAAVGGVWWWGLSRSGRPAFCMHWKAAYADDEHSPGLSPMDECRVLSTSVLRGIPRPSPHLRSSVLDYRLTGVRCS